MDEAMLIAAARLGDEDAFTELYHQHLSYVKAVGRAVLRKSDLEDMCQDTFLLAFTRLRSFEGKSNFRTWITRIAMNQCLVTLRKARQASNGESHLMQIDAQLTVVQGPLVIPELGAVPAGRVEGERLAFPVAGRPVELQGPLGVPDGFLLLVLLIEHQGQAEVAIGLPGHVAQLPVHVESP